MGNLLPFRRKKVLNQINKIEVCKKYQLEETNDVSKNTQDEIKFIQSTNDSDFTYTNLAQFKRDDKVDPSNISKYRDQDDIDHIINNDKIFDAKDLLVSYSKNQKGERHKLSKNVILKNEENIFPLYNEDNRVMPY